MKNNQQYHTPKVSLDTVVESVRYKDNSRKAHRRRVIDQTADAAELVRRTGDATIIYVDKMPTTSKRTAKVRLKHIVVIHFSLFTVHRHLKKLASPLLRSGQNEEGDHHQRNRCH